MANIAQMINVLQSMILTDREKMILTPTDHVFEMYKVHQDAAFLAVDVESPPYGYNNQEMTAIDATASRDSEGRIYLSVVNSDPHREAQISCRLAGLAPKDIRGRVLTADTIQAHHTFEKADAVRPAEFSSFKFEKDTLTIALPAKSVVVLEMK